MPGITEMAEDAESTLTRVVLSELPAGRTVEIKTENSTYWVVPVVGAQRSRDTLTGLMIQTDSSSQQRFPRSPHEVSAQDVVRVGYRWRYGQRGRTSNVVSLRLI
jgi:hypothetical protein